MDTNELGRLLQDLALERNQELKARHNRDLPFAEAVFDRWDRAKRLGFGAEASIYDSALVFGDVEVGERAWIGPNVILDGSGGPLRIGAWCSISAGCHIYTHDTVAWSLTGGTAPQRQAPVTVGDRTYLGAQVVVAAGVTVGQRCVIGANSFVNADVPGETIVAGSPARVIGRVRVDGESLRLEYSAQAADN